MSDSNAMKLKPKLMRCNAKDCPVNNRNFPQLRLFNFPKEKKRYWEWCRRMDIEISEFKTLHLCERHFGIDQFRYQGLIYNQIPRYKTGPINEATGNYCPVEQLPPAGPIDLKDYGYMIECNTSSAVEEGGGLKSSESADHQSGPSSNRHSSNKMECSRSLSPVPVMSEISVSSQVKTEPMPEVAGAIQCVDLTPQPSGNEDGASASKENAGEEKADSVLTPVRRINSRARTVRVLGQQNFQDPSVIKSVLDQANLKSKGSVYVLPLKKVKTQLTKPKIEKIIENSPAMNENLKRKLLTILRGKSGRLQVKQMAHSSKIGSIKSKKKQCTCTLHCKRSKKKPVIKVSPSLYVKMDGTSLKGDMDREFSDDSVFDAETIFTASTIMTNINDKSQIEQLCQLLIESLFKLKNMNTDGTMSKLIVYFSQGSRWRAGTSDSLLVQCSHPPLDLQHDTLTKDLVSTNGKTDAEMWTIPGTHFLAARSFTEFPNQQTAQLTSNSSHTPAATTSFQETEQGSNKKLVKVNLAAFHDHTYLSQESQVLFNKPTYLVNLVNVDTIKATSKKTRIIKNPTKKLPKKYQHQLSRLRNTIFRLKEYLKKKDDLIKEMNLKIKYLGTTLCQKTGMKRIRYPKENTDSERNEADLAVECINGKGNKPAPKPKMKKCKGKVILTPDLVSLPLDHSEQLPNNIETSEVSFDDRLEEFCESLIIEESDYT